MVCLICHLLIYYLKSSFCSLCLNVLSESWAECCMVTSHYQQLPHNCPSQQSILLQYKLPSHRTNIVSRTVKIKINFDLLPTGPECQLAFTFSKLAIYCINIVLMYNISYLHKHHKILLVLGDLPSFPSGKKRKTVQK